MQEKDILILEDDYELAQTLLEMLEDEGYSVDVVYSGEEALEATYEKKYKLYIFDINLSDMNGISLLKSLRDADDTTQTLFISAMVDLESIAQAFEAGAFDYIKKPFFPEELLIRVNAKLTQNNKEKIVYKDLQYFPQTKELFHHNTQIVLSEVLKCLCDELLRQIGKVVPTEILLECLHKPSTSALRVALNKLKQQTGIEIKNIRGVGYIVEKD